MKKYLLTALLMLLVCMLACASALEVTGELADVCCYPSGSTEADATYVFSYRFPVFGGDAAQMINAVYQYEAEYIVTFTLPINGDMYGAGDIQYHTYLDTEVTYISDDYVSVRLDYDELTGPDAGVRMAAHVFALKGIKAGTVVSLPYILGALDMDENDEWLIERQTNKCDSCVRRMVWEMLQDRAANAEVTLYDDADEQFLAGCFYPEEDFYLNMEGDFVFFLQQDSMCKPEDGVLTFTITRQDLLDEL